MGRRSDDSTTKISSSIALLQERFKQLQKVKERREEKELLKMLSESEKVSPLGHFDPSNFLFQSNNMIFPHSHRPNTSQDQSLSLRLDLQPKQDDLCAMRKHPLSNLWSSISSSKSFDHSDIDTSLHL